MMRAFLAGIFAVALSQAPAADLRIYVVDVEGGNATLFVTPAGESVLIDTGNGGQAAVRDADRIMAAAKDAGLTRIDHLITTHWHGDHFGAMSELATRIPIAHFIDHGPTVQPQPGSTAFLEGPYPALYGKAKHTVVKPGDRIPMAGLDWRIVTSAGRCSHRRCPGPAGAIPTARPSSRRTTTRPRTPSRWAASSPSGASGWRTSAT